MICWPIPSLSGPQRYRSLRDAYIYTVRESPPTADIVARARPCSIIVQAPVAIDRYLTFLSPSLSLGGPRRTLTNRSSKVSAVP